MATGGLAGLDRKAMETERLARLGKKRERSFSPPPNSDARKALKLDNDEIEESTVSLPSGAVLKSFSTTVSSEQVERKSASANAASHQLKQAGRLDIHDSFPRSAGLVDPSPADGLQYPNGVVKKTWAFGFDRKGDDVKLEEVLEPLTLRTAVLSAYQWDTEWVLAKLKTSLKGGETKCIFVMQAKDENLRQQMIDQVKDASAFLRLCFPPMDGQIYCQHSKLMLLFHPNKLRIAIPTANLLNFDWGETGVMENSVFMIDLPRLADNAAKVERHNAFFTELLHFIDKQGFPEDVQRGLSNFDFAATDRMAFVHTVGGVNLGDDAARTGFPGLGQAVRQLDLQTENGLQVDFAASSIGSLNDDQLRNMHSAAQGVDMIQQAAKAASTAQANFFKPAASKSSTSEIGIRDKFRIYFPTHDTVRASRAGAAGTICISRKWWEEMRFPRKCFRDYRSTRSGLLSHNKILCARGKHKRPDGSSKDVAWAYVGSANMSESAWGRLVNDKKAKVWKLNCRNWECGVLLPVSGEAIAQRGKQGSKAVLKKEKVAGDDSETESEEEGTAGGQSAKTQVIGIDIFDGIVKPPFEIPGQKFENREPWYFQEYS